MLNPLIFVTLSDNDKRLIFSILIVVIVVLVLIAFLGYLLFRIMRWQSRKMDTLIHDVLVYNVITDRKHLMSYGRKKNWALFFKQAYIPLLILLVAGIVLVIHNSLTNNWEYNPFSTYDGFGTLFWTWKASGEFTGTEWDIIRFQLIVLDNEPHVVAEAWAGYVFGPLVIVGGTWYLVAVSCLLARTFMLIKRSREVFEKSLDGFHQDSTAQISNSTATASTTTAASDTDKSESNN